MIISNIIGGLGNQMFQFAAGRALALQKDQPLKLDTRGFGQYKLHQGFQLKEAFSGAFDIASESEIRALLGWQRTPRIQRVLSQPALATLRAKNLIVEPHFNYWNGIHDVPEDCYIKGYWQSERYFLRYDAHIRADFAFKPSLTDRNRVLADEISGQNAVSLHVRRGDYVKNPATLAVHGVCSPGYYQAAVDHIRRHVDNPVFYVFSDDMHWVRENLTIAAPMHHVDHNNRAYDDMHLTSLCKHHVIANSSFSWWGAWLNANPAKIVVAPKQWFVQPRCIDDLLSPSWVRL